RELPDGDAPRRPDRGRYRRRHALQPARLDRSRARPDGEGGDVAARGAPLGDVSGRPGPRPSRGNGADRARTRRRPHRCRRRSVPLTAPCRAPVQATLPLLVLVHALLGGRAVLLAFGLPVRWHGALFVLALVLSAGIFALVWAWRWY